MLFFALGWLDLGINGADGTTRAIVSGVLALIAFFLGGAAGASALWNRANDGIVKGIVTCGDRCAVAAGFDAHSVTSPRMRSGRIATLIPRTMLLSGLLVLAALLVVAVGSKAAC